jgi:hypothetical protein
MDVRIVGESLAARVGGRIPKVCLKCGATKEITRRDQDFVLGTAGAMGASGGAVIGVAVAASLRSGPLRDDPMLQVVIIVVVFAIAIGLALAWNARQKRVTLALPLCPACNESWNDGLRIRKQLLVGIAAMGVLVLVGIATEAMLFMGLGMVVFLIVLAVAVGAKIPARMIQAEWAKEREVALKIDRAIADKVVEKARKREEKKLAREDAAEDESAA